MNIENKKRRTPTYDTDFKMSKDGKGGLSGHYLYYVWLAIKRRCYDVKDNGYKYYGGRGIGMCDEWKNDVTVFFNWAIENGYKKGLTLDRIDNETGYSPSNCRFTTRFVQQRNRRINNLYKYNGEEKTLAEWAAILDISYSTLYRRITVMKMCFEDAVQADMFAQEKLLYIEASIRFGAKIKEMVKLQGRKLSWVISECELRGIKMTAPTLSCKITGRECFTHDECNAISEILSIDMTCKP